MFARNPWTLAGVCLSLLALVPTSRAQEKVQLRVQLPAGTSWTFTQNEEMSLDSTVKAAGQQQQVQQHITRKLSGTAEVLSSDNLGKPSQMKVTFDRDCGGQVEQAGQRQPVPFALAGQTVTLSMQGGRFSHDFKGQLDPQTQQELKSMVDQDDTFLPPNPVGPGDSWSVDPQRVAQKWQLDAATTKIGIRMTLKEFRQIEGRQAAIVAVEAEVHGQLMPSMSGGRKMSGTVAVDVATGHTLSSELSGTTEMSGLQQQQAPNGDIYVMDIASRGTMKMSSRTQLRPVAGAVSGAPPVMSGGNVPVIGGTAPPPPLSGTYRDERLSASFSPPTGGQPLAAFVDISFGGQQYTGQVTNWDGRAFKGKFVTPDGGEFDFAGTLDHPNMTFVTGGTTYNLRAEPPPQRRTNPLGP